MTITITIMGRKGGITKSTLAVNIAAGCARAGLRTLLIDADGQGNATESMRIKREDGFYALVLEDAEFNDVIRPVSSEFAGGEYELYCLPSADGMQAVEKHSETPTIVYERFQELRGVMDVVIVDTSPGITEVHSAMYYTSDYVLLPTLCEFASIKSLGTTLSYLRYAETLGAEQGLPVADVLGIVPNRFSASEKVQQVNLGVIHGKYGKRHGGPYEIFPPMRNLTVWNQAAQLRQCIQAYQLTDDYNARRQARVATAEIQPLVQRVIEIANGQNKVVAI